MNTALTVGLIAVLPLLAAAAPPTADSPEVWRQAQALLKPAAADVALNALFMTGGAWFEVSDPGLGIRMTGSHTVNGIVKFSGRAGDGLVFEARPLDNSQRPSGYQFVSKALSARVIRSGDGFTLDGQAGGKPLSWTLRGGRLPDSHEAVARDGASLRAWITPGNAELRGRFDAEKMTPEGLAALGAAVALMFANDGRALP